MCPDACESKPGPLTCLKLTDTHFQPNNSPVTSVTSADMACNVGGAKGVEGFCEVKGRLSLPFPFPFPLSIPYLTRFPPAGDSFTVEMHAQPNDRSCSNEAIGGNHYGPVMVYMSKVDDAGSADGAGASWFKVDEFGYDSVAKSWGTDELNKNCGKRTFKVPSKIPAGDYLVRAEAIALHAAGQTGGAQFYMSCYVSLVLLQLSCSHPAWILPILPEIRGI